MRLIDADALPIKFWGDRFVVVAKVDIENAPTVDAVPVVRCKDCVYSSMLPTEYRSVGEWMCEFWYAEMHESDYCSCGKGEVDE